MLAYTYLFFKTEKICSNWQTSFESEKRIHLLLSKPILTVEEILNQDEIVSDLKIVSRNFGIQYLHFFQK